MSGVAGRYDAIVVGGGHNGLVAAAYLARAGLSVLVLERLASVGGAAVSGRPFAGVGANLSRYAYLVSLLPDQIIGDLGLRIPLASRRTASYTPVIRDGVHGGLLVGRDGSGDDSGKGSGNAESFAALTGSDAEYAAWQRLGGELAAVARVVAPTLLRPLVSRAELADAVRREVGSGVWEALFERPIGELIEARFADDAVRGVVLTDALIGAFTHAHDATLLQNRVFLYHVIGNGTGEWRVPIGGMGAVSRAFAEAALAAGAEIRTGSDVRQVNVDDRGGEVRWVDRDGRECAAGTSYVLSNVAPPTLDRLRGNDSAADPGSIAEAEGSQLKVNMVLRRLPRLASGADPRRAFAGTFHIDQGYDGLSAAYHEAAAGRLPARVPSEIYCHTLTDPSILDDDLVAAGWHTLTMFGMHTPARLFGPDNERVRAEALARALAGLDRYLAEPIADCLAVDENGRPCVEAKTPVDLAGELALPAGNIFHGDLEWPFVDKSINGSGPAAWGVETDVDRLVRCGGSARRGGAVSGIGGHNAARAILGQVADSAKRRVN